MAPTPEQLLHLAAILQEDACVWLRPRHDTDATHESEKRRPWVVLSSGALRRGSFVAVPLTHGDHRQKDLLLAFHKGEESCVDCQQLMAHPVVRVDGGYGKKIAVPTEPGELAKGLLHRILSLSRFPPLQEPSVPARSPSSHRERFFQGRIVWVPIRKAYLDPEDRTYLDSWAAVALWPPQVRRALKDYRIPAMVVSHNRYLCDHPEYRKANHARGALSLVTVVPLVRSSYNPGASAVHVSQAGQPEVAYHPIAQAVVTLDPDWIQTHPRWVAAPEQLHGTLNDLRGLVGLPELPQPPLCPSPPLRPSPAPPKPSAPPKASSPTGPRADLVRLLLDMLPGEMAQEEAPPASSPPVAWWIPQAQMSPWVPNAVLGGEARQVKLAAAADLRVDFKIGSRVFAFRWNARETNTRGGILSLRSERPLDPREVLLEILHGASPQHLEAKRVRLRSRSLVEGIKVDLDFSPHQETWHFRLGFLD